MNLSLDNMTSEEGVTRECNTLKDVKRLAHEFVKAISKLRSATVLFYAEMGAGKTTFIRKAVKCLDTRVSAVSPTFSIINKYRENIFHIDLYRVEDVTELRNTDFYEIISDENFVFVEWAEKFEIKYPADTIKVRIKAKEDGSRVFNFTC